MKKSFSIIISMFALGALCSQSLLYAKPTVVASTADMGSIAHAIAGDRINLKIIYKGTSDIHFFEPRPQHIIMLNKADLLITHGLGGDEWLYPLLRASRNKNIQIGAQGFIDPSIGVDALQKPEGNIDMSMGHIHQYGNPHFWLAQDNLAIAAINITKGLQSVLPDQADALEQNKNEYLARIRTTFDALHQQLKPFEGMHIIQYHGSWDYFAREFGFIISANIEPKPGVPPTPGHLNQLRETIAKDNVRMILCEPYYSKGAIRSLSKDTDIAVVRTPLYMQGEGDLLDHIGHIADAITQGVGQ